MPGQDKTGPMGDGPMTGRRMGRCTEDNNPNNFRFGRFGNRRKANRFGRRNDNFETNSFTDLISDLKNQITSLKNEVASLKNHNIND